MSKKTVLTTKKSTLSEKDKIDIFFKDDEIVIKENDNNWKIEVDNKLWKYNKPIKIIKKVSDFIDKTEKISNKINELGYFPKVNDYNGYMIHRIIKIYDSNGFEKLCNSQYSVERTIKNDLLKTSNRLIGLKLNDVIYELVGLYKGFGFVQKELNIIKKKYEITMDKKENKSIWEFYDKIFMNEINDVKKSIKSKTYYIYKIFNKTQQYIFGSYDRFVNKDIELLCKKYKLTFLTNKKIEVIEQIKECFLECQGLLRVDFQINKLNSISNGFNQNYNIINKVYLEYTKDDIITMKKEIFMIVQKEIMIKLYNDKYNYNKIGGYIVLLESKNDKEKKILLYGYENKIIDILKIYYVMRKDDESVDFFGNVKFKDIEFNMLMNDINLTDLVYEYLSCKNKFNLDKNTKKGYENINKKNLFIKKY